MSGGVLGFDTSNYTTSVAYFDGEQGRNVGKLLDVPEGTLGLRQSDALFQHVKRLPDLVGQLRADCDLTGLRAVGASTQPRAVEGSYMPCFLAGTSQARALADVLGVPFLPCSHQQGHLAAAAWSAGRLDLLDAPFLAWHLSGGTTELLHVTPEGYNVKAEAIGGTQDISAGQLIDRAGVLLGLAFPAGKALDALYEDGEKPKPFHVKLNELTFSLSGMENKVKDMVQRGEEPAAVARFVLDTVADVVVRATKQARERYPGLPVLCSGGVASNRRLRAAMEQACGAVFAEPRYSTDNAMGVAILTHRALERGARHE
ncbi:MAG: DNA-binding protein [Ruminococcaceae bacterium]|nr:DNA-binding protein [Oscillospiraceae bacterium]